MQPLNILYIHGFGSRVDLNSEKYVALCTLGQVSAFAPDYTKGYAQVMEDIKNYLSGTDLLIGTSMGGYLVSRLSAMIKKPFVAINPVTDVASSLKKYVGSHRDHFGRPFTLTEDTIAAFPEFLPSKTGMLLLDMGDEVIDSKVTLKKFDQQMVVNTFAGGTHRFSHMKEALPLIKNFLALIEPNHSSN